MSNKYGFNIGCGIGALKGKAIKVRNDEYIYPVYLILMRKDND